MTAPLRLDRYSVGDLQLLTAVDGVAVKTVEGLDLLVADTAAQILLGDAPEGVALDHGVDGTGDMMALVPLSFLLMTARSPETSWTYHFCFRTQAGMV